MAHIGFKALSSELAKKGAKDPDALAAWIGRKKYGKTKFKTLASDGRSTMPHGEHERSTPFDVEASADGRTLFGHAAVFDVSTTIRDFLGEYEEVVTRGAFTRSLDTRKPVVMFEHGRHPLIGNMPLGVLTRAEEDGKGLYIEARLSDNWLIAPVRDAVRDGAIDGMSFRFTIPKGGDTWEHRKDKPELRTVHDVDLIELGPVVFPAYKPTTASIRSLVEQLPDMSAPPRDPIRGNSSTAVREPSPQALARHRDLILGGVIRG